MNLDFVQVLALLVGTVLPLLTGLVTKVTAGSGVKAVVLLALSAVTGFLSNWLDAVNTHVAFNVGTTFVTVLATFLVGVGMHFGIWKPTTLAVKVATLIGPKAKAASE